MNEDGVEVKKTMYWMTRYTVYIYREDLTMYYLCSRLEMMLQWMVRSAQVRLQDFVKLEPDFGSTNDPVKSDFH